MFFGANIALLVLSIVLVSGEVSDPTKTVTFQDCMYLQVRKLDFEFRDEKRYAYGRDMKLVDDTTGWICGKTVNMTFLAYDGSHRLSLKFDMELKNDSWKIHALSMSYTQNSQDPIGLRNMTTDLVMANSWNDIPGMYPYTCRSLVLKSAQNRPFKWVLFLSHIKLQPFKPKNESIFSSGYECFVWKAPFIPLDKYDETCYRCNNLLDGKFPRH